MLQLRNAAMQAAGVLLLACGWCAADARDGPDVDLRIVVEEQAVQLGVTLNLAAFDEVCRVPRGDPGRVSPTEEAQMCAALVTFLSGDVHVLVDGTAVLPELRTCESFEGEPALAAIFPRYGMLAAGMIQVVLSYPLDTVPSSFALTWNYFPIDVTVASEAPRPMPIRALLRRHLGWQTITMTREQSTYSWDAGPEGTPPELLPVPPIPRATSPWLLPGLVAAVVGSAVVLLGSRRRWTWLSAIGLSALAIVLSVRGPLARWRRHPLTPPEAVAVFQALHTNIYRAFDYGTESDIYDVLAGSVDGPLLDELYRQMYQSLFMPLRDGSAVSRVDELTPVQTDLVSREIDPQGRPAFEVLACWQVSGSVSHWGHTHRRRHQHKARYRVVGTDRGWRIAESTVLEQQRLEPREAERSPGDQEAVDG